MIVSTCARLKAYTPPFQNDNNCFVPFLKSFNPQCLFYILVIIQLFSNGRILGQVAGLKNTSSIQKHEISGIVQDSLKAPIAGVLIILISAKDSARAVTNDDGIFVFRDINSATFQLKLSHIGYTALLKKFFYNEVNRQLILDPIILGVKSNELKEVLVNGRPTIVYKTDTVEYKASDYKTTKYAHLDDLLRQMQGVDVGSDGSVRYLGQDIKKARLNGKDYAGGDVAQVIENLPADIAEKIQFIDDYGAQANRTGIKQGDPTKVVNITTKKDRSVGNLAEVSAGEGTDGKYNDRLVAQHLNGNQQIGLIGNITNTVNGTGGYGNSNTNNVTNSSSTGSLSSNTGAGGTSTAANTAFTYRDQLTSNLQADVNYLYTRRILNNTLQSDADQFGTSSPLSISSQSANKNITDLHSLNIELEYTHGAKDYFLFTPVFNYTKTDNLSNSNIMESGLINQLDKSNPEDIYTMPSGAASLYWQHIFNKAGRNLSVNAGFLQAEQKFQNAQSDKISYLSKTGMVLRDSTAARYVYKTSRSKTLSADVQFIEPLSKSAGIQIQVQTTYKKFDNLFETMNGATAASPLIDSLTGGFGYSFLQNRLSSGYYLKTRKVSISAGIGLLTATLKNPQASTNTTYANTGIYPFPILRAEYKWSAEQSASLNYSYSMKEPSFNQLQPLPDYSNALNTTFGNPNLKPSLTHRIAASYFNYLPDQRINIALNVNVSIVQNQIVTDVSQVYQLQQASYLNQTYFQNIDGNYTINSNLSISKQLSHALTLEYNVIADYGHLNALNNNNLSVITNRHTIQRLGPKIVPDEHIQIYPFIAFDVFKLNNNQTASNFNTLQTTSLNVMGNFNVVQHWFANINASKNYTSGLNTGYNNPLLINFYIERELPSSFDARVRFQAFDLLNQNNYINRIITANSITDISSSALKRYFMACLIVNLQKWGGTPSRNGKELKRRGDGSFIYP